MSDQNCQEWQDRYAGALMNTFGPPKLTLERGEGAHVWDTDGKEYVDLLGGIAVNALGHAHPALVGAVTEQLGTLGHISNFFASEPQIELAEKLLALLGAGGAGLLRQLRRRGQRGGLQADPAYRTHPRGGRRGRLPRAHHGRARADLQGGLPGALRAAARRRHLRAVRRRRGARRGGHRRDRRGPARADPGRGGRRPAAGGLPAGRPRDLATEHGALLWLDEVQTGIGRTGRWFAHQAAGVTPDIVTVAKGLAGGFPIGACVALGEAGTLCEPGNHGTTFGGNPVACAAALAVIDTIESDHLLEHVDRAGPDAPRRAGRRPPRHRGPWRGAADRPRPGHRRLGRGDRRRPARTASSSTTRPRTGSGSRRRWC